MENNEKELAKLESKINEATAKIEQERLKYEPVDLEIQQATDNQAAMTDREKVASEEVTEAKAAIGASTATLKEFQVHALLTPR